MWAPRCATLSRPALTQHWNLHSFPQLSRLRRGLAVFPVARTQCLPLRWAAVLLYFYLCHFRLFFFCLHIGCSFCYTINANCIYSQESILFGNKNTRVELAIRNLITQSSIECIFVLSAECHSRVHVDEKCITKIKDSLWSRTWPSLLHLRDKENLRHRHRERTSYIGWGWLVLTS